MRFVRVLDSVVGNRKSKIQNPKLVGIFAVIIAFAMCGVEVPAQQPKKIPRIAYLGSSDATADSTQSEPFRLALRESGYIDGQNISIEYRYAQGKLDRLPELASDLVRLKVDIIVVAGGDTVVRAAKNATKTIPIVMAGRGIDPVVAGLVESLSHPGGNVTGVTHLTGELGGKRLELLKDAVPKIARLALLYDPAIPGSVREMKDVLPAAHALGLTVKSWELRDPDAFEKVFAGLNKELPDALYVPIGPRLRANAKRIAAFALKSRLPSVGSIREYADAGGLIPYNADIAESYQRVATYVDRILKGAKPGDLPVQQAMKFEFIINLNTAKQIGLTIPPQVLARADRVIK